ncbi:MAG: fumarylacetoacetate hydrolase family protein [Bradyrhizobium sp.]|uniref:2-keto-4-pentenoate hydratase n=1 Tax=Bradyrhizobium sp. TaxID=376 RepID=UPI001DB582C0|nr:fumarylacetoacetate hydrolase family protein [Bradyrhizobium sp.]MBV9566055.1 fumarylacetoacetate hydrolase family protein [Bradyrhizobium sp.]
MDRVAAAATAIAQARRTRTPLQALPEETAPRDLAEGYRIQRAVHDLMLPQTGALTGYKIGCTSKVMQDYLAIPHPCAGGVFARGVHDDGARLSASDFVRVGVECEIAVKLSRDLPASERPFDAVRVGTSVEAYLPAIEIVDDRYARWQKMGAASLIADDFFAAGCVLAQPVSADAAPDLAGVVGRAIVNGSEVARGTGADVLGHPLQALAWLANHLAAEGRSLHAGQFVLTGSLVKTLWLGPGDHVVMELEGLGQVEAAFV